MPISFPDLLLALGAFIAAASMLATVRAFGARALALHDELLACRELLEVRLALRLPLEQVKLRPAAALPYRRPVRLVAA